MRTLLAVDITEDTEDLEDVLRPLLKRFDGPVDLLHVARPALFDEAGPELRKLLDAAVIQQDRAWQERLRQVQASLVPDGRRGEVRVERDPGAAEAIVRAADGHDLLVVGTHGRTGPARAWAGSVAERVVRSSPIPVLVARGRSRGLGRMLLAVDLSPSAPEGEADRVLAAGAAHGEAMGMVVDVLYVRPPPVVLTPESGLAWRHLEEAMEELERSSKRQIRQHLATWPESVAGVALVETGDIVRTVVAKADSYDVVMVATHGRRGVARMWLGSVAERVVRMCEAPVLVAPVS
ncbi:MAG: universal stress protein [Alphaproteobacteria bacterium]|nr:universal stress protein [Alphaproteobacteria bacterium]MCB9696471.1 universal stress protein [Alphaproteobacteria bacterium]